ncbi:MAG: hypothetical protein ABIK83_15585 [Candidatus Zixiibacteriota bacterium]
MEDRIVYSINVEDIQNVAGQEIGRALSELEIGVVERELGGFIAWYDAISATIELYVQGKSQAVTDTDG